MFYYIKAMASGDVGSLPGINPDRFKALACQLRYYISIVTCDFQQIHTGYEFRMTSYEILKNANKVIFTSRLDCPFDW